MMQKIIPHIFFTFIAGALANCKIKIIKNFLINAFITIYKPNLEDAMNKDVNSYKSYNDFFTRKLAKGSRTIESSENILISPVDGEIVDHGFIKDDKLIQAKKYTYRLKELVGKDHQNKYKDGYFITIYLAPTDYHRIHCPWDGEIIDSNHLGTSLYSVNKKAQECIPNLYIRNERSVLHIASNNLEYAVVSVGASVVGSIVPFWINDKECSRKELVEEWKIGPLENTEVKKGDELAYFKMGSTVVLIFDNSDKIDLDSLEENKLVKFGNKLVAFKNI
tara:strand:+ start:224 stop:1057 length:834 start_codon:yes stop_codon:yes gene_type:complete